ncbi:MAG: FAD-dependent oxidoreductase [Oceanospirillaceae bacterium]|jgi:D-amino-acid dehydrogenase|nr:FAD-dependent oxidoreductase [Oceanospirillaceae bacterium]MBT6101576.1 FAD-dependent oxidoreductase [Oceanospirillaceae bacterium]MDB9904515.1 FAD-dependent oxidoreductase [Oceanospirillaceae bacterium]MDC0084027.1 FAD-dependent oxidoreductase [Oceanospirillaceae bacterium]MDO7554636.1 FAD-dependent oxidoreductase [Oceanospirillaceae bacterium]
MNKPYDIIVIGAGIVGISIAKALQQTGRTVTLIDRKGVALEASKSNAGAFAFADIVPLATPRIMRQAPKWLLDPLGPLSIPPAYALTILPWMMRFWRASWPDRYEASLQTQAQLMTFSQEALERQVTLVNGERFMQREGQLQLYEGLKQFNASQPVWKTRSEHGIDFQLLHCAASIAEIQPGLDTRFTHAGYTPKWLNTCDPEQWAHHIAEHFMASGGALKLANIEAIFEHPDYVSLATQDGELRAKQVVVASGAWSHKLTKTLGDHIPLETERGYNTTLPAGAFDLKTHLTFGAHGFVVTKIAGGIRVGGAVELGGLNLAPNYARAQMLLDKAAQFLPTLNTQNGEQWMGFRPSMPDSLPVIGSASKAPNVFYAFGHGHLGLTQAAGTAELVTALANGTETAISIDAFSPNRF